MSEWNTWKLNMMEEPLFGPAMVVLGIWSLFWTGLALWKSARNDQRYWFVALLLTSGSTLGILDILYLFVFAKNKLILVSEPPKSTKVKSRQK